jgi:protein-tyrosine phosphatase
VASAENPEVRALYTVNLDEPGLLSTMAKPRGGDWLAEEMSALKEARVDVLVSVLTESEEDEAGLRDEALEASFAGLRFVSVPIADMGLPDRDTVLPVMRELATDLTTGLHVVTHCWAGIGRSSLLAATLMVLNGMAPNEAWRRMTEARGRTVPETAAQREWIFGLS